MSILVLLQDMGSAKCQSFSFVDEECLLGKDAVGGKYHRLTKSKGEKYYEKVCMPGNLRQTKMPYSRERVERNCQLSSRETGLESGRLLDFGAATNSRRPRSGISLRAVIETRHEEVGNRDPHAWTNFTPSKPNCSGLNSTGFDIQTNTTG